MPHKPTRYGTLNDRVGHDAQEVLVMLPLPLACRVVAHTAPCGHPIQPPQPTQRLSIQAVYTCCPRLDEKHTTLVHVSLCAHGLQKLKPRFESLQHGCMLCGCSVAAAVTRVAIAPGKPDLWIRPGSTRLLYG